MTISCKYISDIDGKTFNSYEEAVDHETTHQVAQDLSQKFSKLLTDENMHLLADWVYQTYIKDAR